MSVFYVAGPDPDSIGSRTSQVVDFIRNLKDGSHSLDTCSVTEDIGQADVLIALVLSVDTNPIVEAIHTYHTNRYIQGNPTHVLAIYDERVKLHPRIKRISAGPGITNVDISACKTTATTCGSAT